jgi:cation diffusion facilitator CzcD-associated flavoprotein CzcO
MTHVRIAIIGAGFGGLGTAIRLSQRGERGFLVFERESDVGGTWWANTYPGCQCDIPSHLYSFSFAPNPDWTRTYPKQPELRDYLRATAQRFGVYERIRFNTKVTGATWDEAATRWTLETGDGATYTADLLVAAPGPLSEPSIPDLPGLEDFAGTVFHTATWNHDHDLSGRKVAFVGTGASAIQAVPEIQPIVDRMTVFQRTPPWVVPHRDRPITRAERFLYKKVPAAQRLVRSTVYGLRELLVPGLAYRPQLMNGVEKLARRHIAKQVPDPTLRAMVTPGYAIGCKRILPSNKWYPALGAANVELLTDAIAEVRPRSVVTAGGEEREVDTIIFGTGFHVSDLPISGRLRGRDGRTLADHWDGSPRAYKGAAVAGFPNLFFLVGPNTGLGHNSIVFMIESQITYAAGALKAMRRRGAAVLDVRPEAQAAYNAELEEMTRGTVWVSGGCSSYYIDRNGHNSTIWPTFTWPFRRRTREFDEAAYVLGAPAPARVPAAA